MPPDHEFAKLLRDPVANIAVRLAQWVLTQHPVYAWEVIGMCAKRGSPLPPQIIEYLADVARRMEENREAGELRSVLPKIMGFPDKGPGPGRPLNPDSFDPDDLYLVALFATELALGRSVSEALKNVIEKLPARFSNYEDRALKARIKKAAGLEFTPSTADEWLTQLRARIGSFLDLMGLIRDEQ